MTTDRALTDPATRDNTEEKVRGDERKLWPAVTGDARVAAGI